jgi:hypothetical protein
MKAVKLDHDYAANDALVIPIKKCSTYVDADVASMLRELILNGNYHKRDLCRFLSVSLREINNLLFECSRLNHSERLKHRLLVLLNSIEKGWRL